MSRIEAVELGTLKEGDRFCFVRPASPVYKVHEQVNETIYYEEGARSECERCDSDAMVYPQSAWAFDPNDRLIRCLFIMLRSEDRVDRGTVEIYANQLIDGKLIPDATVTVDELVTEAMERLK